MILLGWFTALIYINRVPVPLGSVRIRFGTVMETVIRKWVPHRKNGIQARYGGVWDPVPLPIPIQAPVSSVIKDSGLGPKFPTTHSCFKTRGSVRRYVSEVGYDTVTTDSGFVFKLLITHFAFVRNRGSVCTYVRMYGSEVGYGTVTTYSGLVFEFLTTNFAFVRTRGSGRMFGSEVGYGTVIYPKVLSLNKYMPQRDQVRSKKFSFLRTFLTSLDMAADGYAWAGYQWENGWPVAAPTETREERAETENLVETEMERTPMMSAGPMQAAVTQSAAASLTSVNQVSHTIALGDQAGSQHGDDTYTGTSYCPSDASDSEEDVLEEKQIDLGSGYVQCRAAREAANVHDVVDISCNENAMSIQKKKGDRVGSFDNSLDDDIKDCFKGARIEKNGITVNQFISSSFDPATGICITCSSEHPVLEGGENTSCFVLSDQNFVASLPGCDEKKCLNIVRIENASLIELVSVFIEIMEGKNIKPGTCVLIVSLSYLARVGVSAYTAEWRTCVHMLASKWSGVLTCPVFPLHVSPLPGHLFGELLALHAWFKRVYSGTTHGLSSVWDRYTKCLMEFAEGAGSLDQPEFYTPLLPSSLDPGSPLLPVRLSTSSTSPTIIFGFDRKATHDLLLSLATSLRRSFSFTANPEVILAREPATISERAKEPRPNLTIILAGASNLGSLKPIFEANGANVVDLSKPGWIITEKNVADLITELTPYASMEDTAVIFDLFGNSVYKFKHVDGSLVLPFRVGKGYHLLGDIQMDTDENNGLLIDQVKPIFALAKNLLTAIMAPLPRWVFNGCCREIGHSTNVGGEGYASGILDAALHFRKILKTKLVGNEELGQFWVLETLVCLENTPPTMDEKLSKLKPAFGPDGVHLSDSGRYHTFNSLAKTILGMRAGTVGKPPNNAVAAASSSVSGKRYYWRGFTSDRGSAVRPTSNRGRGSGRGGGGGGAAGRGGVVGRGGQQRPTPYARPDMGRAGFRSARGRASF